MAYITLDELKKVLPEILDEWIDEDDEGWDWVFQEIEQRCHIGKKKKGKKWKKRIEDDIYQLKDIAVAHRNHIDRLTKSVDDVIPKIMGDFDSRINVQTKRIDGLSNKVSNMNDKVNRMDNDIRAAKLMAQTAMQRTEVDYTQISECCKEKSDADVVQEVYNRMSGRGATFEELDAFRKVIQKYDALNKKEIPVVKKMCETCKHYVVDTDHRPLPKFNTPPCNSCNGNDKWEKKEVPIVRDCGTCKHGLVAITEDPCSKCLQHRPELPNWETKDNG